MAKFVTLHTTPKTEIVYNIERILYMSKNENGYTSLNTEKGNGIDVIETIPEILAMIQ